jgi:hypothetical protein
MVLSRYYLSKLGKASFIGIFLLLQVSCHHVDPEDVRKLRSVCNELVVPASFLKIREHNLEKPEVVIYSAEYLSSENLDEVEHFFRESLEPKGWSYRQRLNGSTKLFDFRQTNLSIVIEFEQFSIMKERHYSISCGLDVN